MFEIVLGSPAQKIFRVRVGDYRIRYVVFYDKNQLLITDIDKRPHAYD